MRIFFQALYFFTFSFVCAQQVDSSLKRKINDLAKWEDVRKYLETAVEKGEITRQEANHKYARYRSLSSGRKHERKDPILDNNFKKLGVENINEMKNKLLDRGISSSQLDAVLGGMLRLVHAARKDGENFKTNSRIEQYFKERIGLTNTQVGYLIELSKKIALNLSME